VGLLKPLSAAGGDGIDERMKALVLTSITVLTLAAGCEVRPLRSADLYGAAGAGPAGAGGLGVAGAGGLGVAGAGGLGVAGAGGRGGAAGQAVDDAAVDQGTPDAPGSDGGTDGPSSPCPQTCASDQFCDELTTHCVPRAGTGMLSGTVIDPCSGQGLDARIGIAGQHQCSAAAKGSYFVSGLPLGRLKLAALKDGYELYGDTVEIVPGGVIRDIRMVRTGGCGSTPPVSHCTCTEPSCTPMTP
jgi:hypothetical protein